MTVLLVDPDDRRRALFALAITAVGADVVEARTPLGAIERLQRDRSVAVVLVAASLGSTTGSDFLAFMASEFPGVRRTLLADPDRRCVATEATAREP